MTFWSEITILKWISWRAAAVAHGVIHFRGSVYIVSKLKSCYHFFIHAKECLVRLYRTTRGVKRPLVLNDLGMTPGCLFRVCSSSQSDDVLQIYPIMDASLPRLIPFVYGICRCSSFASAFSMIHLFAHFRVVTPPKWQRMGPPTWASQWLYLNYLWVTTRRLNARSVYSP